MTGRHRDEHGEPDGGVLLDGIPDREGAKDPDSRAAGGVTVLDLHGHLPRAEPVGVDGKLDGVAPHRDAEPGRLARGERFRQHQPVLLRPVGRILRVELCPFGEFAAVCQYTPVEAEDDLERGERRPAGVAEGAVDRQHRVRVRATELTPVSETVTGSVPAGLADAAGARTTAAVTDVASTRRADSIRLTPVAGGVTRIIGGVTRTVVPVRALTPSQPASLTPPVRSFAHWGRPGGR